MPITKISQQIKDEHEQYISESLPCIRQLKEHTGKDSDKLDFSLESLKFIDDLVSNLKKEIIWYKDYDKLSDQEKWFIVRLAYYVVEILIRNNGGRWELDKVKSSLSFGKSVIRRNNPYYQVEPLNLVLNLWKQGRSFYDWYDGFKK